MRSPKTALLLLALPFLLAPSPARGAASAWSENEQSRVRLVTEYAAAPRSGPIRMGLQFTLSPGWHVYWKNSGDAGFPPAVTFSAPGGTLTDPQLFWPAPRRFELPGGLVAFGYEKEAVYPIQAALRTNAEANGDLLTIAADVDYLVCEVDCIPYRYTLTLDQPLADEAAPDPEARTLLDAAWARLPARASEVAGLQTGGVVHAGKPEEPVLEVRLRGVKATAGTTDLFLETHERFDTGKPQPKVTPNGVVFRVPLKPREAGQELPEKTTFVWTVTGLEKDGEPLALEARREVPVDRTPEAAAGGAAPPGETEAAYRERLLRLLLQALLGGLLLNGMPTVLAVLLGGLFAMRADPAGQPTVRERAAAAATGVLGGSFVAAALAVWGARAGFPVGWGAQLEEPAVAAVLLVAALVLMLNLWSLVEVPLAVAPEGGAERPGTARHLLTGLFTVPLALAWTLPALDEPVGFAAGKGPAVLFAVFAALGAGLALPYLLLVFVPSALRVLPAPGRWSRILLEGLGFLAGASVLWLLYSLSRQVTPEGLAWIELTLIGMALFAWLRHRAVHKYALRFGLAMALAACAAAVLWLADDNRLTPRPGEAAEPRITTRLTGD
ncbi:MAG TPA: protein-disulfide reductase DsbD domain-containing protein [Thermoanaerobaculia bacterium]|nr:protein-disulfide reductase DsbD domain-containing protein [Thermoanaerobaculia bacterium]